MSIEFRLKNGFPSNSAKILSDVQNSLFVFVAQYFVSELKSSCRKPILVVALPKNFKKNFRAVHFTIFFYLKLIQKS